MVARRVENDEDLNAAMRAARGSTYIQDTARVPQNHKAIHKALRKTREAGLWRVDQRWEEDRGEGHR